MTNVEAYETDFNKLVRSGELLDTALKLQCYPEEANKQIKLLYKDKTSEFIKKTTKI